MNAQSYITIVTDLGYGDAGKGSIVDYLAREHHSGLVVRFNGGAQAAHNVITPTGQHHTFKQFGSASFLPDVRTHLSRFMLVNPLLLWQEAGELTTLGVPELMARLSIDERALIITPYHQAANRLRELARGSARHGSCGHGIGETMSDSIEFGEQMVRAADLAHIDEVLAKLEQVRRIKLTQLADVIKSLDGDSRPEVARELQTLGDPQLSRAVAEFYHHFASIVQIVPGSHLGDLLEASSHSLFEGAQGVLLDEWYGFHPYTTWSTTTNANADTLLGELGFNGRVEKLGLLRAYATRHGAGPFVTEDHELTTSLPDAHNGTNAWQQGFRVGHFDVVAARYALDVVSRLDGLVITNLDRLYGRPNLKLASHYEFTGHSADRPASFPARRFNRIIRSSAPDLNYQQALTDGLMCTTPQYQICRTESFGPADEATYLEGIEQELGMPVVITSTGPTALHKRRLP